MRELTGVRNEGMSELVAQWTDYEVPLVIKVGNYQELLFFNIAYIMNEARNKIQGLLTERLGKVVEMSVREGYMSAAHIPSILSDLCQQVDKYQSAFEYIAEFFNFLQIFVTRKMSKLRSVRPIRVQVEVRGVGYVRDCFSLNVWAPPSTHLPFLQHYFAHNRVPPALHAAIIAAVKMALIRERMRIINAIYYERDSRFLDNETMLNLLHKGQAADFIDIFDPLFEPHTRNTGIRSLDDLATFTPHFTPFSGTAM